MHASARHYIRIALLSIQVPNSVIAAIGECCTQPCLQGQVHSHTLHRIPSKCLHRVRIVPLAAEEAAAVDGWGSRVVIQDDAELRGCDYPPPPCCIATDQTRAQLLAASLPL